MYLVNTNVIIREYQIQYAKHCPKYVKYAHLLTNSVNNLGGENRGPVYRGNVLMHIKSTKIFPFAKCTQSAQLSIKVQNWHSYPFTKVEFTHLPTI